MKYVVFDDTEVEEPDERWKRAGLANSDAVSVD